MTQSIEAPTSRTVEYAVHLWRGDSLVTRTEPTCDQQAAKELLPRMQAAGYPESVLVLRTYTPDDFGAGQWSDWEPATEDQLNRIAIQHSVAVLASLVSQDLPLVPWMLQVRFDPGSLSAYIDRGSDDERRTVLGVYAALLGVDMVEDKHERTTSLSVSAVYAGVPVHLTAYVDRAEQVAAVTA